MLEDGGSLALDGDIPASVPLGYHDLIAHDGTTTRVIVTPRACHLPGWMRIWGWAVQLYATRSRQSWGIGDLADLRRLGEWSAKQGAGMLLVNPLHAALPVAGRQQSSPYFPSSRCFRNPLYLALEAPVPDEAAALNADRRIDRNAVFALKMAALEASFDRFQARGGDVAFDQFRREMAPLLGEYATFCALAEAHGTDWRQWPDGVRSPRGTGIAAFVAGSSDRIAFHSWLQWRLDQQLAHAARSLPLVQDLAIGCDPAGADAWLWQDTFAAQFTIGAPPDGFNQTGQDWGLPPFDPWKLRAARYEPFIETVRAGFRHAGGMRVDHVMGLFRLFWIPCGGEPAAGGYVRYPASDLLDILALESVRAGAWVVGEDLGTVEERTRLELKRRKVLSYRLFWFEAAHPRDFPEQALAAVTTHDLPTIAGLWTGSDLAMQRSLGVEPNEGSVAAIRARLRDWLDVDDDAGVNNIIVGTYRMLGQAPSMVVSATLEDALAVEERPNYPSTTAERNWSMALPAPLEAIFDDPLALEIAKALASPERSDPHPVRGGGSTSQPSAT